MSSNKYWADRIATAQNKITDKTARQIKSQFKRYYNRAMESVIKEYEATHNKLLATLEADKQPTPADLYNLNRYWEMQGAIKKHLERLGDRQIRLLSRRFEMNYFDVYYAFALKGQKAFATLEQSAVKQLINSVWVADGKSWSRRIWDNTSLLADTLNEELINIVLTGKKTSDLKKKLQNRFGVAFNNADMLARTELAHIQTEASKKRYEDYGIQEVEIWADYDERRCPECGKLHKKRYPVNAQMPIPAHPRCRCCIVPVVKNNNIELGKDE